MTTDDHEKRSAPTAHPECRRRISSGCTGRSIHPAGECWGCAALRERDEARAEAKEYSDRILHWQEIVETYGRENEEIAGQLIVLRTQLAAANELLSRTAWRSWRPKRGTGERTTTLRLRRSVTSKACSPRHCMGSTKKRRARTRKHRRGAKAQLRHGANAKRRHRRKSGRTGKIRATKIKGLNHELGR